MKPRNCAIARWTMPAVCVLMVAGSSVWAADEEGDREVEAAGLRWEGGVISMDSSVKIDANGGAVEETVRRSLSMDLAWNEGARVTGMSALILERLELSGGEAVGVADVARHQRGIARRVGSMALDRNRSRVGTPLPELPPGTSRIEILEGYVEVTLGVGEPQRLVLTIDEAKAKRVMTVDGPTPLRIETDFDAAGNEVYLWYVQAGDIQFGEVRVVDADGNEVQAGGGASWSGDEKMQRRIGVGGEGTLGVRLEMEVYREVKVVRVPLILRGLMLPGHVRIAA